MKRFGLLWLVMIMLAMNVATAQGPLEAGPVPDDVRERLELDEFYTKHISAYGLPIVASDETSDAAVREAGYVVRSMMQGRPEVLEAMAENGSYIVLMAYDEYTTDLPEYSDWEPRIFYDSRGRGWGGLPTSAAEENILCHPNDPYATELILIHELAHSIHSQGMSQLDPTFEDRLGEAYDQAMEEGLWKGTYAATNKSEYWAEAVQSWFDDNRINDSLHNHVGTRDQLKEYDARVAALCAEAFGENDWRYVKPTERTDEGLAHLQDVDFENLPPYRWRDEELGERPLVLVQTAEGDFTIELYGKEAPHGASRIAEYSHRRYYADGGIYETLREDNQPGKDNPVEGIIVRADPNRADDYYEPVPIETTGQTGMTHQDGTVTLVPDDNGMVNHKFLICIGDQPQLDESGSYTDGGKGYAAVGRVVEGMDTVRKLHAMEAEGRMLKEPVLIQRAVRRN